MLIALISLFVLPVAMAKNLEPVVRNTYNNPSDYAFTNTTNTASNNEFNVSNVLGATDVRNLEGEVIENVASLRKFTNYSSTLTDLQYDLTVSMNRRFNKIEVFRVVNNSSVSQKYILSTLIDGDIRLQSNQQKYVYINDEAYLLSEQNANFEFILSPEQEALVYLASTRTTPTNLSLSLRRGE
jgi:hypothetical protein